MLDLFTLPIKDDMINIHQKIILHLTTSTQQMILRRGQSTPAALLPKLSTPPKFLLLLFTPTQPPPALPPYSTLLADDSTNIVDIIKFCIIVVLATPLRRTPADTLEAAILPAATPPAAAPTAAALPAPRSSLMMAKHRRHISFAHHLFGRRHAAAPLPALLTLSIFSAPHFLPPHSLLQFSPAPRSPPMMAQTSLGTCHYALSFRATPSTERRGSGQRRGGGHRPLP